MQVALDLTEEEQALHISSLIGRGSREGLLPSDRIIVEAGTPLIKTLGLRFLPKIKLASGNLPLMADLKTADVGELEASLAYALGSDIASVLARAPIATVKSFLKASLKFNKKAGIDFIGVPVAELGREIEKALSVARDLGLPGENIIVFLHRGIDEETMNVNFFHELKSVIGRLRELSPETQVAIAGGITPQAKKLLEDLEPDIFVVGRYITQSPSIERIREFFQ